jgi:hypothetical protein
MIDAACVSVLHKQVVLFSLAPLAELKRLCAPVPFTAPDTDLLVGLETAAPPNFPPAAAGLPLVDLAVLALRLRASPEHRWHKGPVDGRAVLRPSTATPSSQLLPPGHSKASTAATANPTDSLIELVERRRRSPVSTTDL